MTVPLLNIQNASVVRGERRILDNLCLTIGEGEHTAIVGPNGSGKSSLIKLISRRFYPLAGRDQNPVVEIFGRSRWDIFELQSMLGILSSDLHNTFSNDETLIGSDAALSGFFASQGVAAHHVITDQMRFAAAAALEFVDATHLESKRLATMSTGEVRRVLIARALVAEPRALLLDEPTTGLDLGAMSRFLATIRHVAQSGRTLLLVTHHIEEIIHEINRVILMKDGKIFKDGPKEDLLNSETLSDLFQQKIEVRKNAHHYSAILAE